MTDITKIVAEMRSMGDYLARIRNPEMLLDDEEQISVLKSREIVVDGYDVLVHYGKVLSNGRLIECLQCQGRIDPFLPFFLVFKIARKFLGDKHLCFIDTYIDNKKVYCWTLKTDWDGNPLAVRDGVIEVVDFEGMSFSYLDPQSVQFS